MANNTSNKNANPILLPPPHPSWMKDTAKYSDEIYKFLTEVWRRVGKYKGNK